MAVPEEHREKVMQYFARVEYISNQIKADMSKNPVMAATIVEKDIEITRLANQFAAEQLGFSYYPWPFSDTEPDHYEPIGEQNG
jgi:hypothetical protein